MFGYVACSVRLSLCPSVCSGLPGTTLIGNCTTNLFGALLWPSAPSPSSDCQQLQVFAVLSVLQAKAADFVPGNFTGFPRQLTKWMHTTTDWKRPRWSNLILVTAQWECSYAANFNDRKLLQLMQSFSVTKSSLWDEISSNKLFCLRHSGVSMNVLSRCY